MRALADVRDRHVGRHFVFALLVEREVAGPRAPGEAREERDVAAAQQRALFAFDGEFFDVRDQVDALFVARLFVTSHASCFRAETSASRKPLWPMNPLACSSWLTFT